MDETSTQHLIASSIARELSRRGETAAIAETSAGGLIAASLIGIPGASAWFVGGVIPYAADMRLEWLGLGEVASGAVSGEMAKALAEAVRTRTGATWGVGETGIAGPQVGRRSRKPTGLGFVAVAGPTGTFTNEVTSHEVGRHKNQVAFATAALTLLYTCVTQASSL